VFLTKQPLFLSKSHFLLKTSAYFFANNKRLTLFMEQGVSLVNTRAHKAGSHLEEKTNDKRKTFGGNAGNSAGIRMWSGSGRVRECAHESRGRRVCERDGSGGGTIGGGHQRS
jgi:hypothetical protein